MQTTDASEPERDAAWWAVRLAADDADASLRRSADAWIAADRRRAGQLLRAQAALLSAIQPVAVGSSSALAAVPVPTSPRPVAVSRRWLIASGGTLAAGLASGALLLSRRGRVATDIGEIRRLPLEDGSTIALNSGSVAEVRFDERERRLHLSRGEALFRVAKAEDRPFVVSAGPVTVTAIGTIFAVRNRNPGVQVLVTQGLVDVRDSGRTPVRMEAGERGLFGLASVPEIVAVAPDAAARALAWRDGRMEFDGELVADAIAEVNRHNRRTIRLADPALGREPVFGAFRTDDPSGFAQAVAASLGQPVDERPREIIIGTPTDGQG